MKKILLCSILAATNLSVFAESYGVYTTVTKLEGNAVTGQATAFKISYKWLSDGDRSGKITYNVADTNCHGDIVVDKHSGYIPVAGETEVKCTFNKSAVFKSTISLQLYDGNVKKEHSNTQNGLVTVTNQ